jgi:glycosyltransferase involved in cell wall biosynthesis
MPQFTVIIPVYNVSSYLRDCLDSVLAQSFTDYEVICINDGSTDESGDILNEYSRVNRNIKVIHQENKGLSAARNAGMKAAHGEYIFFLDSDDWLVPNALEILKKEANGEDIICFNGRRYFEDGSLEVPDEGITESNLSGWDYYNQYALKPRKFHFVCTVLRIYRREFLLQYQLFFEEGIYHEDNLFTPIACYYAKSVKVIPDILYVYRIRANSITQNFDSKRILDIVKVANKLAEFFIPINNLDKTTVYREIAGEYFIGFSLEVIKKHPNNNKELKKLINWDDFRMVATYPRHKIIYRLLKIHPALFRVYLKLESKAKTQFKLI